jgi:predicted ATPase
LGLPPAVLGAQQMLESYELLSCSTLHQGKFAQSLEYADRGLEFYEGPRRSDVQTHGGQDLGVACHTWAAMDLWCLGYPDQASERMRTALDLAEAQGQRYTLARALSKAAIYHQMRREPDLARDCAEASLAHATNLGFPYYMSTATMVLGWARALLGDRQGGIVQLREALAAFDRTKTAIDRPLFLGLLAEAYASNGQAQEALAVLDEALESVSGGRSFFYEAELHRLRGSVLQQAGPQQDREAAEASFQQSLETARRQQARSLELRTLLALDKLRQAQGDPAERDIVRAMLAEAVDWFTEGLKTPDLREARTLLEAMPFK